HFSSKYLFGMKTFLPNLILTAKMMRQKIEYIHFNPVKAGFVEHPVHWLLSSAVNYEAEPQ
ncbi:MAG: transposase, partial [Balneolaceae bacterium]|nr:transposase [Balneolaceae bacterium]